MTTSERLSLRRVLQLLLRISVPTVIMGIGVAALVFSRKTEAETEALPEDPKPVVFATAPVLHEQSFLLDVDGTVVPYRDIKVAAEVSGLVVKRHEICRAWNYVTQGTPLIQLDRRDYQLEVTRLEQQVAQCDADLVELVQEESNIKAMIKLSEEDVRLRMSDLNRMEKLFQDEAGSESDVDRSKQALLVAQIQLQTHRHSSNLTPSKRKRLEAKKAIAESQLELANINLQRTQVSAPTTGVIVDVLVEQGDYIQKGFAVLQIEDTSRVEVSCNLQMDEMYWLWAQPPAKGTQQSGNAASDYQLSPMPATVVYQLADQPQTRYCWQGMLTRFDGVGLDERTRTMPCRVVVDDPSGVTVYEDGVASEATVGLGSERGPRALVRGMFVTVQIEAHPAQGVMRIPEAALQPGNKMGLVTLSAPAETDTARGRSGEVARQATSGTYRTVEVRTRTPWQQTRDGVTERFWLVELDESEDLSSAMVVLNAPRGLREGADVSVVVEPAGEGEIVTREPVEDGPAAIRETRDEVPES